MSDAKEIAREVVKALEDSRNVGQETHENHHDFIETFMRKEERKQEIWEQVKIHLVKSGALATAIFLGWLVWNYVINAGDI